MTTFVNDIDAGSAGRRPPPRHPPPILIPPELLQAACARLVSLHTAEPQLAARRFIETAADLGIDLSLMWGTIEPGSGTQVRQVCLAVLGAGRTAMLFLSGDPRRPAPSDDLIAERAAIIEAACRTLAAPIPGKSTRATRLAQVLLEPKETSALQRVRRAGFRQLGDLAYMRREPTPIAGHAQPLPSDLRAVSIADLTLAGMTTAHIDACLLDTLEQSYIETRDCPELCGLRDASDVLESHKAVGRFDPAIWWLLMRGDTPVGCSLFSVSPEHDSLELVYLGLSPSVRGRGVGSALLDTCLRALGDHVLMSGGVTCAVDTRNTAALRLYQRAGFRRFSVRIPMIRSLAAE